MKKRLDDLRRNPRVELIPSLLNLPIVLALLALVIIARLDIVPGLVTLINDYLALIFGVDFDFIGLFQWFSIIMLIFITFLIISTVSWRKRVPAWLHLIPGAFFIVYEYFLISMINNEDNTTIHHIYHLLGYDLGIIVYLVVVSILLVCVFSLIDGIPKLWNARTVERLKFQPRILAIVTVLSSGIAFSFLVLFIYGHQSMIFWHVIMYDFEWLSIVTILQVIFIVFFAVVVIFKKKERFIVQKFQLDESKFKKMVKWLKPSLLVLLALLIIIDGIDGGFPTALLNPLSVIAFTELLFYLFVDFIFPRARIFSPKTKSGKNKHLSKTTIVVAPLIWIFLFQPLVTVPPEPGLPVVELNVVRNTYASLTVTQKAIFDTYLNAKIPPNATPAEILASEPIVPCRGLSRLASGLLFRNGPGDVENASFILDHLMDTDWNCSFTACELIVILERHQGKLNSSLISRIEDRLVLMAEWEYARDIRPTYTNMALMSAFIMQYVGLHEVRPEIRDAGIRKSWEIFLLFQRNNTFSEFNSPTYGGVDMVALTMWRELGPTETMRRMGAIMEEAFWKEIAAFYHAGFKNMVGPYFRTYGMDMLSYTAIIGIWIALVIDDLSKAPMPSGNSYETSNIFPMVQMGHSLPSSDILQEFTQFSGARYLKRRVPSDISNIGKEYEVTAMLHPDWMMGGVSGRVREIDQFVAGTLTWNSTDDSLAWLRVSGEDNLDVEVTRNSMNIYQNRRADSIVFTMNCYNLTTDMISGSTWNLPGIELKVDGDPSKVTAELVGVNQVKITCLLDQITLQIVN